MGWFDGFPFTTKEERERRRKEFEKRVTPFGVDAQREKLKATLTELFPRVSSTDILFAFYFAKDAYTKKEDSEEGLAAARQTFRRLRWLDADGEKIMLKLLEMENGIMSLDEFPTGAQVIEEMTKNLNGD